MLISDKRTCTLDQARQMGVRTMSVNGHREDLPSNVLLLEGFKTAYRYEVAEVADKGLLAVVGYDANGTPVVTLGWKHGFGRKPPQRIV